MLVTHWRRHISATNACRIYTGDLCSGRAQNQATYPSLGGQGRYYWLETFLGTCSQDQHLQGSEGHRPGEREPYTAPAARGSAGAHRGLWSADDPGEFL